MNTTIKELSEQADLQSLDLFEAHPDFPKTVPFGYFTDNRNRIFADLIIQKCIKICEQQATLQFDAYHFNLVEHDTSEVADQCAKEIKEYFGIE